EPNQPAEGERDPLTELARTVASRGLSGGAARSRSAARPQPNMLGDLEAEMMGEAPPALTVLEGGAEDGLPDEPETDTENAPPPPETPAQAPSDGVARDRLTDALAALAPVLKFDRPLDAPAEEPAAAEKSRREAAPLMAETTSARFREAMASLP